MLEELFGGQPTEKVERILFLTERMEKIRNAIRSVQYDDELVTEIPEVLKTLAAAKDAVTAELKTL